MSFASIGRFVIAGACLLGARMAQAGPVTVPNTFTAGTTAQASQVNDNFTAVKAAVDDNDARIAVLEAPGSVTSARIADGTVTFADWSGNACAADQVPKWSGTAWTCAADASNAGTVTSITAGAGLTGGTITGAGAIGIAAGGVGPGMIAAGAVGASNLAAGAVTAGKIAADTVGSAELAAGSVGTTELAAGSVTTPKLAAASVGAAQLSAGAVSSANAFLGYRSMESRGTGRVFHPAGTYAPYCISTSYTPATNQVAFVDAAISWYTAGGTSIGSANVIYSTDNGATWSSPFSQGAWTTAVGGAWTTSTKSDVILLTANVPYRFAAAGWSGVSTAFTSSDSVCALRVVFAAR